MFTSDCDYFLSAHFEQRKGYVMTTQHVEVTVLWNGGWDIYIVDPGQICDTPAKKMEGNASFFPTWHEGPNSRSPWWLKCSFVNRHNFGRPQQSVKVIKHVGGGD